MLRIKKSLVLLLAAVITTASVPFTSFAGISWADKFAAEYNNVIENTKNPRTDWARETADAPVVSIYKGMPENNVEGQFDMAGAIKAFEYAQAHRFPQNGSSPLKAYVWDDTLAGFAQKMLQDEVTLGVYDKGVVLDNTGRFDQSKVYGCDVYLIGTSGYPYDFRFSNTCKGKTVDEAILRIGDNDGLRNPLNQNDYNMKVGAAVLNHNGEKLLLFIKSEEGRTDTWKHINEHGGVDNAINESGFPITAVKEMYASGN